MNEDGRSVHAEFARSILVQPIHNHLTIATRHNQVVAAYVVVESKFWLDRFEHYLLRINSERTLEWLSPLKHLNTILIGVDHGQIWCCFGAVLIIVQSITGFTWAIELAMRRCALVAWANTKILASAINIIEPLSKVYIVNDCYSYALNSTHLLASLS